MPRLAPPLVALLAASAVFAACGEGGDSPEDAVRAYNTAIADGDGERACAQLDPAAQEELKQATQGSARGSCKQVIDLLADFYDEATKERLRDVKVEARSDGDRATADVRSPATAGGPGPAQSYELRRVEGDWRIVSLGLTPELGIEP